MGPYQRLVTISLDVPDWQRRQAALRGVVVWRQHCAAAAGIPCSVMTYPMGEANLRVGIEFLIVYVGQKKWQSKKLSAIIL